MPETTILHVESDELADSLYLHLSEKAISHSIELDADVILDVAEDRTVVGIDLQHVGDMLKEVASKRVGGKPSGKSASLRVVYAH